MNTLSTTIKTFLDKTGFTQYQNESKKNISITENFKRVKKDLFDVKSYGAMKNALNGYYEAVNKNIGITKAFKKIQSNMISNYNSIAGNQLVQMGLAYFTINGVIGQYTKAIESANYKLEQGYKLRSTLIGQNFTDEQIENIKQYVDSLESVGVVGADVTLAGAQQLATYNLTEENLKKLIPAMQDIIVQQKGLASTGGDAVSAANMLAKGILGKTGELGQAGINLTAYQEKLVKFGNQEEKVAALVEAVRMNIGEQNKEFFKTPEGKIAAAKNRIAGFYENLGMIFRDTRSNFWDNFADIFDIVQPFVYKGAKALSDGFDTISRAVKGLFKVLSVIPPEAKATIAILGGILFATYFPIAAAVVVIEDIIGAFMGKESVIEPVYDKMMEFLGLNTKFADLRKEVQEFWKAFVLKEPIDEISKFNASLKLTLDTLLMIIRTLKHLGSMTVNLGKDGIGGFFKTLKNAEWSFNFDDTIDSWDRFMQDVDSYAKSNEELARKYLNRVNNGEIRRQEEQLKNFVQGSQDYKKELNVIYNVKGVDGIINQPKEKQLEKIKNNNTVNNNNRKVDINYKPVNNINVTVTSDEFKGGDKWREMQERINKSNLEQFKAQIGTMGLGGIY